MNGEPTRHSLAQHFLVQIVNAGGAERIEQVGGINRITFTMPPPEEVWAEAYRMADEYMKRWHKGVTRWRNAKETY